MNSETVLVTGGSGFIGSWCVIALLQQGYVVRATIRDLASEPAARAAIAAVTDPGDRLSFHAATLTEDAGWDAAMAGCDYLLHVASPLSIAEPKDPDILIRPAREGARRALSAAIRAGVKRVVLTSSVAATRRADRGNWMADETVWTDTTVKGVDAYAHSKTLAERAAWEVIEASDGKTTLATVNPALVLGPALSADYSESLQVVERLLNGRLPGLPRLGFNIVDVRDVADLHIRAMTAPEAAGQRLIAAGHWAWMADIAAILRDGLGEAGAHVIQTKVPDVVVRFGALFDKDLRFVVPNVGHRHDFSADKAKALLGWQPRPLADTVLETARSLIAAGAA